MSETTPTDPGHVSATGDAWVDEAVGTLRAVEELSPRDQVAAFEQVHAALQERLTDSGS